MSDTSSTASIECKTALETRRSSTVSIVSMAGISAPQGSEIDDEGFRSVDEDEVEETQSDTFDDLLAKLKKLSGERGCPVPLKIIGSEGEVQEAKELVGYFNSPTLHPMNIHGIANLSLFLSNAENPDCTKDEMKREVRSFMKTIHHSTTAQREITHLDIGYAPILTKLHMPTTRAYDSLSLGEKRLKEEMDRLADDFNASSHAKHAQNRALLLRLTRWISLALPNIHTLTIHLDKDHFLCTADSYVCYNSDARGGFIDEIISPLAELQEVNVVCAEPFVALSWSVSQGRVFSSVDRMSAVVEKLRSTIGMGERSWSRIVVKFGVGFVHFQGLNELQARRRF